MLLLVVVVAPSPQVAVVAQLQVAEHAVLPLVVVTVLPLQSQLVPQVPQVPQVQSQMVVVVVAAPSQPQSNLVAEVEVNPQLPPPENFHCHCSTDLVLDGNPRTPTRRHPMFTPSAPGLSRNQPMDPAFPSKLHSVE